MRLSPKLIRQARAKSVLLPPLLRPNRTIESASRELSWIQQELPREKWVEAVKLRSHYFPLQYILGSQPFGDLDVNVAPGVLIPRWETEEWTLKVIDRILTSKVQNLKVLEMCTGTGCISLLMNKKLTENGINHKIDAVDVSEAAIQLARQNKEKFGSNVNFKQGDIFSEEITTNYDLIVSNPPYIPQKDFHSSELSVKLYEPELALIGDLEFYDKLVELTQKTLAANFIFELGYLSQAERVRSLMGEEWRMGVLRDSSGYLRCVIGTRETRDERETTKGTTKITEFKLVDICDEPLV